MSIRKSFDIEAARAIGLRIKEARGDTTQAEFATLIEVDRATLSNYETGRRIPNNEIIKRIEMVSAMPDNYILHGKSPGIDYIGQAIKEYQREFVSQSQKNPGFYPKWFFSDFEVAFIRCFRACPDFKKKRIVDLLLGEYTSFIEEIDAALGATSPNFEEQSLAMIKAAAEDGSFEGGTDVERMLWDYIGRMRFTSPESSDEGAQ